MAFLLSINLPVKSKTVILVGVSLALILQGCSEEDFSKLTDFDPPQLSDPTQLESIAFGSCSHQDSVQRLWPVVMENAPDLWIWLGDNVYGDTENMRALESKYFEQKSNPDYLEMRRRFRIIGVWDDHDYGVNDGGKEYPKKRESRDLLFDFLDVEFDDPARKRAGAYQSYLYGNRGNELRSSYWIHAISGILLILTMVQEIY